MVLGFALMLVALLLSLLVDRRTADHKVGGGDDKADIMEALLPQGASQPRWLSYYSRPDRTTHRQEGDQGMQFQRLGMPAARQELSLSSHACMLLLGIACHTSPAWYADEETTIVPGALHAMPPAIIVDAAHMDVPLDISPLHGHAVPDDELYISD